MSILPLSPSFGNDGAPQSSRADGATSPPSAAAPSKPGQDQVFYRPIGELLPSPENDTLYKPVDPNDPEIVKLAKSIREQGVLQPLIVTLDRYILSGHRRFQAAKIARVRLVPIIRVPIRRADDIDAFVRLLREHNRQRDKTLDEKLREELVTVSKADAIESLREYRREKSAIKVESIDLGDHRRRCAISPAKLPFLKAVQRVLEQEREFWPLSLRRVHYLLLNAPPLRHARKPKSVYRNDKASYKALSDLMTRASLAGLVPPESIDDITRTTWGWDTHDDVRAYFDEELRVMFHGYRPNRLRSQPNMIHVLVEKNTAFQICRQVADVMSTGMTSLRGYCATSVARKVAVNFKTSGKDKLILLAVTDFDPEGFDIVEAFGRSMRDDYGISSVEIVKVAVTREHVERFKLEPNSDVKVTSSRYKRFVKEHGTSVYELEAIDARDLQQILREAITAAIDVDLYNAELEAEEHDAQFLMTKRQIVLAALGGVDGGQLSQ